MRTLGINCGTFPSLSVTETIPYVKNAGFDCMFTCYEGDADLALTLNAAAKHGLHYDFVHAPFRGINRMWKEGEEGEQMLSILMDCIESSARHGVDCAIVHLSSGDNSPHVNDLGRERFDRLIYRAGELGVKIAFENQRKLANLAFVMELYENLPHVGFCWDNAHEACFAYGREFMPLFGGRTMALHIHDNYGEHNGDLHMLPFDGALDFDRFARHIRNFDYKGTLMLETIPGNTPNYNGMSPEAFYARAYDAACRLRVMVDGEA